MMMIYWIEDKTKFFSLKFLIPLTLIQFTIGFFRTDFLILPIIFLSLAYFSKLLDGFGKKSNLFYIKIFSILFFCLIIIVSLFYLDEINAYRLKYAESSASESGSDSLGMRLIVNAPMLIRIPMGLIFLLINPIPFWIGFTSISSYDLLKSLNALFMIWIIPLVITHFYDVIKNKIARSPSKIFLILVILIFVLAISLTSMETRHLGNFLIPFLILATLFDHEIKSNSRILKITNFFYFVYDYFCAFTLGCIKNVVI